MTRPDSTRTFRFPGPLDAWWNYRRKRFWVVVCVLVYTLTGFLLAPWLLARQLDSFVSEELGLELNLRKARVNPYSLTVELEGLAIAEPGQAPLVGFERLFVNLQASSLFRLALVLREISLEGAYGNLVVTEDGSLNLLKLVPATDPATPEEQTEAEASDPGQQDPFPLLIRHLQVIGASATFRDETRPTPFTTAIGPVDITLNDLNTLPELGGLQNVSIAAGDDIRLDWSGELDLSPLSSSGHFSGSGRLLALAHDYFDDDTTFSLDDGGISLEFDYRLSSGSEGLQARIEQASLDLQGLDIRQSDERGENVSVLEMPELSISGTRFAWPENALSVTDITLSRPALGLWLSPQGALNLLSLVDLPAGTDEEEDEAGGTTSPFTYSIDRFAIDGLQASFTDYTVSEEARIDVRDFALEITGFSGAEGASFPFSLSHSLAEGGLAGAEGRFSLLPEPTAELSLTTEALPLTVLQPWLGQIVRLRLDSGELNQSLQLAYGPAQALQVQGDITVSNLDVTDTVKQERLAGWQALTLAQVDFDLGASRLEVAEVRLDSPYARVTINDDGSTNLGGLGTAQTAGEESVTPAAEEEGNPAPFEIIIDRISVNDASSDFSDFSLPLPFAARISNMQGGVSTLANRSAVPASVNLQGEVDSYGLAEISGELMPFDPVALLDLQVLFRNVELPNMSPYTIKFAGQEIDEGRLDLDLQYSVMEGQVLGANNLVIRELRLGDKVDHPDAVNLPLGLAVALLKKPDGTIDLDLEVSGDVNDPEFGVGAVVLDAFVNLITRVVSAPFNFLGRLVGAGDEHIGEISFRPGLSALAPPEREKLDKLKEALALRPELALEIPGTINEEADSQVLREQRIADEVNTRLAEQDEAQEAETGGRRQVVESLALERLEVDLPALQTIHTRAEDEEDPDSESYFDEAAYLAELVTRLEEATVISAGELEALANDRAEAIRAALLLDATLDESRLSRVDTVPGEVDDSGWIPLELVVNAQ